MAAPITFKPLPVDPKKELQRRLEAAPYEHGEALLVLWDLLQTAHDEGILDLLDGMVSAKDKITLTIAKYAKTPEGVASIRNLLTAAKLLGELDPQVLDNFSRIMEKASVEHQAEAQPPSLWKIFRRATSVESRKAISLMTLVLQGVGRSLR